MKKITIFLTTFYVLLVTSSIQASAHVLIVDGSVGAVMHIDPDDSPVAKQQSAFFFEFKDTQNKFQPKNCDCEFSIVENGSTIYSQPLFETSVNPSLNNASVFYTFPQEDVYQVKVVGKPNTPNSFQQFTLIYNVRVDQIADTITSTSSQTNNFWGEHLVYFLGLGFIIIGLLMYIAYSIFHKKNPSVKGGEKNNDKEDNRDIY